MVLVLPGVAGDFAERQGSYSTAASPGPPATARRPASTGPAAQVRLGSWILAGGSGGGCRRPSRPLVQASSSTTASSRPCGPPWRAGGARCQAAVSRRPLRGDVEAVRADRRVSDPIVQARFGAAAAQPADKVTAGFGEQVPTAERAVVDVDADARGDVDGHQLDVDYGAGHRGGVAGEADRGGTKRLTDLRR